MADGSSIRGFLSICSGSGESSRMMVSISRECARFPKDRDGSSSETGAGATGAGSGGETIGEETGTVGVEVAGASATASAAAASEAACSAALFCSATLACSSSTLLRALASCSSLASRSFRCPRVSFFFEASPTLDGPAAAAIIAELTFKSSSSTLARSTSRSRSRRFRRLAAPEVIDLSTVATAADEEATLDSGWKAAAAGSRGWAPSGRNRG